MEATHPDDPTEQFLTEIAAIRVRRSGRDTFLLRAGAALMPGGVLVGVVAWFVSHNTDNPLDQRDAVILALVGVSISLVGVALFIRYSLGEFFRYWMARLIHEQAAHRTPGDAVPAAATDRTSATSATSAASDRPTPSHSAR